MSGRGFPCWECGQPAEGGVCLGPHEGYAHNEALNRQMVMDLDRVRTSTHPGRLFDEKEYQRKYYRDNRERLLAQRRLDRRVSFQRMLARAMEETLRMQAGSSTARTGVERLSAPFAPPAPGGGEPAGAQIHSHPANVPVADRPLQGVT